MIRVVGLNPVIDRLYYIDNFHTADKFFEIVPNLYAGGKGVNIARVMGILEEPCVLYSFLGGDNGRFIEREMEHYHVEMKIFPTEGETRTTINIIDNANRKETEITEPGVAVEPEREAEFLKALEEDMQPGDMVICSGIPMKGMNVDVNQRISRIVAKKDCLCVLDATGIYLERSFPGNYYFFKPNFSELSQLFHMEEEETVENIIQYGKKMLEKGVENLLISMGSQGGIFLDSQRVLQIRIPKVAVVSTIGSGDASVAGYCVGTCRGFEKEDCLRLAMACGISNARFSKVGYVEKDMVWELYKEIEVWQME